MENFTYLDSNIFSTESSEDVDAIDRLSITWNSDLSDKIKRDFFQALAVSILLYG